MGGFNVPSWCQYSSYVIAIGGKPSTWLPPRGLVEHAAERKRPQSKQAFDCGLQFCIRSSLSLCSSVFAHFLMRTTINYIVPCCCAVIEGVAFAVRSMLTGCAAKAVFLRLSADRSLNQVRAAKCTPKRLQLFSNPSLCIDII
jgi:hypothetical protein